MLRRPTWKVGDGVSDDIAEWQFLGTKIPQVTKPIYRVNSRVGRFWRGWAGARRMEGWLFRRYYRDSAG
jgi:hypothetical protein